MIQEEVRTEIKTYRHICDNDVLETSEEFGLDNSLTSLKWLQTLNCRSGLNFALQTPLRAPPPRMSINGGYALGGAKSHESLLDQLPTVTQLDEAIKKQHEIDMNLDWAKCNVFKPPHNYAMLIYMAIRDNICAKVTLNDIYGYIQSNFQYYRNINQGWKNSIRHNLTQNKFFKKTVRPDHENTLGKGGFWTLNMNMQNVAEFSRGVWKLTKVRMKPATSKSSDSSKSSLEQKEKTAPKVTDTPPISLNMTTNTRQNASRKSFLKTSENKNNKPYKSVKLCKGVKVGKNGSPKNRRRTSSTSSANAPIFPTMSVIDSPSNIKLENDLDWNVKLFHNDCKFEDDQLFNSLYSDSEGSEFQATLDNLSEDDMSCNKESNSMKTLDTTESLMTISADGNECFSLSDHMIRLDRESIKSHNLGFDSLISSFEDITTDETLSLKDVSLEVVGVSMSLFAPPESCKDSNSKDLGMIMEEMEKTSYIEL